MWKLDNQNGAWVESQQSGLIDKSKITLAAAVLAVGLSTSVQANTLLDDILKQCDGIDRQWVIHKDNKNWIIDWFAEKKCEKEFDLAKGKEDLAKINNENNQLIQILAMLDSKEARKYLIDEIKKIETQLKTEKDEKKRKSLTYRLETLKTRLADLDKKVA